jgi:hypothetical protein
MSRFSIVTLWVLLGCTATSAAELNALELLKAHLGDAVEVISPRELRYCPDNTCDIFRISREASSGELPSYVFLYLFHVADYAYLDESSPVGVPFRRVAKDDELLIRRSMQSYCRVPDKSPQCILQGMKQQLGISVHFGRYDEGAFHEAPVEDGPEV